MTFKELDSKGKLEHIWEYYKLTIFMVIFIALCAISLIYTIFIKPHPALYCGIAMYDQFVSMEDSDNMTTELNNSFNLDTDEYSVDIESFYTDDTDVMVEAELSQKFDTYIYASQLQILLADGENTNKFAAAEYVTKLSDFLSSEEIAQLEDKGLVLHTTDPTTNESTPMAVDISNSTFIKKYKLFEGKKCYLSFVPMPAEYTKNTVSVYRELLK